MLKSLYIFSFLLLFINGIGACYGGWLLVTDPTGNTLQLPLHYLRTSPFRDYLIPGIILFLANGVLSLMIAILTIIKWKYYTQLIILQGCILTGWIIIQIYLLQMIYFLHFIMGVLGLLLMLCGWILTKR